MKKENMVEEKLYKFFEDSDAEPAEEVGEEDVDADLDEEDADDDIEDDEEGTGEE